MTLAITKRFGRQSWMAPFGQEGFGDVFFDRLWPEWQRDFDRELLPTIDFYEKDGKYYLIAELPGLKKDDISISLKDGCVTINGNREFKKEKEGANYYVRESKHGAFCRSFQLPRKVDPNKMDATYKDGILTLVIPHEEASDYKRIKIH